MRKTGAQRMGGCAVCIGRFAGQDGKTLNTTVSVRQRAVGAVTHTASASALTQIRCGVLERTVRSREARQSKAQVTSSAQRTYQFEQVGVEAVARVQGLRAVVAWEHVEGQRGGAMLARPVLGPCEQGAADALAFARRVRRGRRCARWVCR